MCEVRYRKRERERFQKKIEEAKFGKVRDGIKMGLGWEEESFLSPFEETSW